MARLNKLCEQGRRCRLPTQAGLPVRGYSVTAFDDKVYIIGGRVVGEAGEVSRVGSTTIFELGVGKDGEVWEVLRRAELSEGLEDHTACLIKPCTVTPTAGICLTGGKANRRQSRRAYLVELGSLQVHRINLYRGTSDESATTRVGHAMTAHPGDPCVMLLHGGHTQLDGGGGLRCCDDWYLLHLQRCDAGAHGSQFRLNLRRVAANPGLQAAVGPRYLHHIVPLGAAAPLTSSAPSSARFLLCGGRRKDPQDSLKPADPAAPTHHITCVTVTLHQQAHDFVSAELSAPPRDAASAASWQAVHGYELAACDLPGGGAAVLACAARNPQKPKSVHTLIGRVHAASGALGPMSDAGCVDRSDMQDALRFLRCGDSLLAPFVLAPSASLRTTRWQHGALAVPLSMLNRALPWDVDDQERGSKRKRAETPPVRRSRSPSLAAKRGRTSPAPAPRTGPPRSTAPLTAGHRVVLPGRGGAAAGRTAGVVPEADAASADSETHIDHYAFPEADSLGAAPKSAGRGRNARGPLGRRSVSPAPAAVTPAARSVSPTTRFAQGVRRVSKTPDRDAQAVAAAPRVGTGAGLQKSAGRRSRTPDATISRPVAPPARLAENVRGAPSAGGGGVLCLSSDADDSAARPNPADSLSLDPWRNVGEGVRAGVRCAGRNRETSIKAVPAAANRTAAAAARTARSRSPKPAQSKIASLLAPTTPAAGVDALTTDAVDARARCGRAEADAKQQRQLVDELREQVARLHQDAAQERARAEQAQRAQQAAEAEQRRSVAARERATAAELAQLRNEVASERALRVQAEAEAVELRASNVAALGRLVPDLDAARSELEAERARVRQLEERSAAREREKDELQDQAARHKSHAVDLEAKCSRLQASLDEVRSKFAGVLESHRERVERLKSEAKQQQDQQEEIWSAERAQLQASLDEVNRAAERYRGDLEAANAEKSKLVKEVEDLRTVLSTERKSHHSSKQELEAKLRAHEAAATRDEMELSKLRSELRVESEQRKALAKDRDELDQRFAGLRSKYERLTAAHENARQRLSAAYAQLKNVDAVNEACRCQEITNGLQELLAKSTSECLRQKQSGIQHHNACATIASILEGQLSEPEQPGMAAEPQQGASANPHAPPSWDAE